MRSYQRSAHLKPNLFYANLLASTNSVSTFKHIYAIGLGWSFNIEINGIDKK